MEYKGAVLGRGLLWRRVHVSLKPKKIRMIKMVKIVPVEKMRKQLWRRARLLSSNPSSLLLSK